tara:strand:+ start:44 stop:313 length:270 start_codon:yes stop_codon:yes gene_type:complete
MKEKILDILEKHYHGRNYLEERCAQELLGLSIVSNWVALNESTPPDTGEFLCYSNDGIEMGYWNGFTWKNRMDRNIQPTHWTKVEPPCC